jgi:predicted outer membrane repeat protein
MLRSMDRQFIPPTVTIVNSTISGNHATYGGGIYNSGGHLILGVGCHLTITNCSIFGNTATDQGGGIYNLGDLTVTNSTISDNSASYGGAIENAFTLAIVSEGRLGIRNSTVSNNLATIAGGGDSHGQWYWHIKKHSRCLKHILRWA